MLLYRYLFVKKKVFYLSELHFSEVTSYKIHTLEQFFLTVGQNNFGNKIPFLTVANTPLITKIALNFFLDIFVQRIWVWKKYYLATFMINFL